MFLAQKTVKYKTYFKRAIIEGLSAVFASHPDDVLRSTNVTVEFPNKRERYPAVVVRFDEREVRNAGVGHIEFLYANEDDTHKVKFRHSFYTGTLRLTVYALSTLDRDLITDTLAQALQMSDTAAYTKQLWNRLYNPNTTTTPDALYNFINLNHDVLTAVGEGQMPPPWNAEDDVLFTGGYSLPVFGEFYSLPPDTQLQRIESVTIYPYVAGLEPVPTGVTDPSLWE